MAAPDINFKDLHVLVIDDEEFTRKLIARLLYELEVHDVTVAKDGAEALSLIKQIRKSVDVIFCDLDMPNMNGLEFVRRLRNDPDVPVPNTPVLILTGHSEEENVQGAVELGIHGFLAKPISMGLLEKRIATALTSPPIDPKVLKRG